MPALGTARAPVVTHVSCLPCALRLIETLSTQPQYVSMFLPFAPKSQSEHLVTVTSDGHHHQCSWRDICVSYVMAIPDVSTARENARTI